MADFGSRLGESFVLALKEYSQLPYGKVVGYTAKYRQRHADSPWLTSLTAETWFSSYACHHPWSYSPSWRVHLADPKGFNVASPRIRTGTHLAQACMCIPCRSTFYYYCNTPQTFCDNRTARQACARNAALGKKQRRGTMYSRRLDAGTDHFAKSGQS